MRFRERKRNEFPDDEKDVPEFRMFRMSSPATQYVYIPNLVGRQMLRISLEEVEAEDIISFSSSVSQSSSDSTESARTHVRDSSRSPSISSVSSVEEAE
ncbi:hypothetical protein EJ07DRAFT_174452 [Lizonia empirigonia]|nr:hypothetical protein EJ07DRAFT_174452 [Lizonia empirigonia]